MLEEGISATCRGFYTPPPKRSSYQLPSPATQTRPPHPHSAGGKEELFHVLHKVPAGDSPYVRAKHVQLIEKDPSRAISLFWAAINSGDKVDSALKDMAVVMKQLNRSDEAIEAIKSFRHLSPAHSQESIDNILLELYKKSGRFEDEIYLLEHKLKNIEESMAFGRRTTKIVRSQGKKTEVTLNKEYSRLLGNLAWAYMQTDNFKLAEENYRKALSLEPDKNKQCNLAICLMQMNKIAEAKFLLQSIRASSSQDREEMSDSCCKSLDRAMEMLSELERKPSGICLGRKHGCPVSGRGSPRTSAWSSRASRRLHFEKPNFKTGSHFRDGNWRRDPKCNLPISLDASEASSPSPSTSGSRKSGFFPSTAKEKMQKSWADMVEEEEEGGGNDENEEFLVTGRVETLDINGGYHTQPEEITKHHSKCFDTSFVGGSSSAWHKELNFDNMDSLALPPHVRDFATATEMPLRKLKQRNNNRLQVFQDITP
ncbi:unnamed protein product [Cuscuta campestris]|uniref:Uncharacterized protein n=1 Tax=Cuscuta campestris TaxID=132261 RepID=A0A484LZ14_9ASTE|nr:unnamed protein product [Cuscuta campestris]